MSREKFLQTLFKLGDEFCFAQNPYETFVSEAPPHAEDIFFSINPMHTSRADANVTCYRNILLECDNMPIEQQLVYIQQKVPVTSIVYSGGKSYHFIISLAEPCSTREEYDILVKRLHRLLPEVDPTTKNPSRFSRLPFVMRPDTNRLQELMYLGSQISAATLYALLPPAEVPKVYDRQPQGFFSSLVVDAMFSPDSVMQKIGIQSRNQFFFWLGQRLIEGSANRNQREQIVEQAYANLRNKSDFKLTEARHAARLKK